MWVGPERADDQVVKTIAVEIARRRNGTSTVITRSFTRKLEPIGPVKGRQIHIWSKASGLAEYDVAGPRVDARVVRAKRSYDNVGESIAVDVSG